MRTWKPVTLRLVISASMGSPATLKVQRKRTHRRGERGSFDIFLQREWRLEKTANQEASSRHRLAISRDIFPAYFALFSEATVTDTKCAAGLATDQIVLLRRPMSGIGHARGHAWLGRAQVGAARG